METYNRYWLFAAFCILVGLFTLRLILRERITLQGSLSLLGFLCLLTLVAVFPDITSVVARTMGFTLPSNFFFSLAIAALTLLYLSAQISISRLELRTISLTQELGILRERLERPVPGPIATPKGAPDLVA